MVEKSLLATIGRDSRFVENAARSMRDYPKEQRSNFAVAKEKRREKLAIRGDRGCSVISVTRV